MLSSVEADQPKAYVHSGLGEGVVDTAPLWPTTISVNSDWTRNRDQTIEFWFRQPSNSTSTYCVLSVGLNGSNKLLLSVQRSNHGSLPGRVALTLTGSGYNLTWSTTNRYDDGEWHHCVIVLFQMFDVMNQFFYIDGQFESQNYKNSPFVFGSNWGNTTLGDASRFAAGYVITGSPIDEIALYDYELPDDRIEAHYNEVMHVPAGPSVAIAGQIDISGSVKTNKLVRLDTAQFDISGAVKVNKLVRLTTAQIDISGSLLVGKVVRLNTAQIDISGSVKTNKLVRLNTAQFDVDGFIRTLILKDLLPFSISSQIDIFGKVKAALVGKEVAASTRMQSNELDTIVQTGIGVRI